MFFEEAGQGPQWHINLVRYRTLAHGEQNDPAPLILWAVLVISFALFIVSLVLMRGPEFLSKEWGHFTVPLLLTIEMIRQHLAFASDRKTMRRLGIRSNLSNITKNRLASWSVKLMRR